MSNFIIEDKDKVLIKYKGKGEKVVTIPNSVTTIGNWAFENCRRLKNIVIPKSVTTIGDNAFLNCSSLEYIVIPNSVTTIGENIFKRCSNLKNVKAPAKFKDTLLKELGNKVEFIDSNEKK